MLSLKRSLLPALAMISMLPLRAQQASDALPASANTSSSSASLPEAPSVHRLLPKLVQGRKTPPRDGAFAFLYRGNVSCGSGSTVQSGAPQSAVAMCGMGFTFLPGVQVEFGGIGPQGGYPRFYISADGYLPLARVASHWHAEPVALLGYTKLFYNSNDLDFGLAWDRHVDSRTSMVYEVRDYVQFSSEVQHTVLFRINYVIGGDD